MSFKESAQRFKIRFTTTFSFENIVLMLTIGLVLLQVVSYVLTTWFPCSAEMLAAKEACKVTGAAACTATQQELANAFCVAPRYFGPYLLLVIIAAIVMIVFLFLRRSHNFATMGRFEWALLILTVVLMVAAVVIFRQSDWITPALFKSAASNLASMVGLG